MPTHNNITLSLRSSAHETMPLLEFPPPPHLPADPAQQSTVYVAASPGLGFWIAYHVKPPVPPGTAFFVFKLFMEGRHVVTWAVGEENGWKGKTMFGLYENYAWKGGVEKRAFAFASERDGEEEAVDVATDHESGFMEVRVMRANARKRVQRETPELKETEVGREGTGGIKLVNAGCLKKENPRRYYKFALIDSLNEPFARFRYYYRSLNQLETLGVVTREPDLEHAVTESGNGYYDLDLSFLGKQNAKAVSPVAEEPTLVPEFPEEASQETLDTADSTDPDPTEGSLPSPPTSLREVSDLMSYSGFSNDNLPRTPSPLVATPTRSPVESSPWSPKSLRSPPEATKDTVVEPMTAEKCPTKGSVAEATMVEALMGQGWLKRTPSPVRCDFREFDSPLPGTSRRGKKSPTGRLRDVLKRALRRGES